jgi:hypothetical protein
MRNRLLVLWLVLVSVPAVFGNDNILGLPKPDDLTGRRGTGKHMIGFAIEEPAALIIRGNHLQVLGNGSTHVFVKSAGGQTIMWRELGPRDSAVLKVGEAIPVHLIREETKLAQ